METRWKGLIIVALVLSIISLFVSGLQSFTTITTTTNRVYLETEVIQDEGTYIVLFNPYSFEVFDIYLLYKLAWYNNNIRLENSDNYHVIRRESLGGNGTWRHGPFYHPHNYTCQVVDAYAYGVKP